MEEAKQTGRVALVFLNCKVHGCEPLNARDAEQFRISLGVDRVISGAGIDGLTVYDPGTHEQRQLKPMPGAGVTLSAFSIHERLDSYEFTLSAPDLDGMKALIELRRPKQDAKRGREFI